MTCILIMRDNHYVIVGPFGTRAMAAAWGRKNAYGPGGQKDGDPRWQMINLADPRSAPIVLAPDEAETSELLK